MSENFQLKFASVSDYQTNSNSRMILLQISSKSFINVLKFNQFQLALNCDMHLALDTFFRCMHFNLMSNDNCAVQRVSEH